MAQMPADGEGPGRVESLRPAGAPIDGQAFLQREGGPLSEVQLKPRLTPTQEAGMKLALWVGIVILMVIGFVCVDWVCTIPPRPALGATRDIIDNYKDLRSAATDDASKLFTLVVLTSLLPVFTAILGYIFGSKQAAKDDPGAEQ